MRQVASRRARLQAVAVGTVTSLVLLLPGPAAGDQPPRDTSAVCPADEVPPAGFADVAESNPHLENIDCVAWLQITEGTSTTTFEPARPVRRDQMASFIARTLEAAGLQLPDAPADHFSDDDGNSHELPINQLAELGVVRGTAEGEYSPTDAVRRDQMASFLSRAYEALTKKALDGAAGFFSDVAGNAHEHAINAVAGAGIVAGTGPGVYGPTLDTRRDQMTTMLIRLIAAAFDKAPPTPDKPDDTDDTDDPADIEDQIAYSLRVELTSFSEGPLSADTVEVDPRKELYDPNEEVRLLAPEELESDGVKHFFAYWSLEPPVEHEYDHTTLWITMEDDVTATAYYESVPAD